MNLSPFARMRVDLPMLLAVLTLVGLGVVMVAASSPVLADADYHDAAYFLKRQIAFACAGSVALLVGASIDPAVYERRVWPIVAAAFVLLVVVLVPHIGHSAGGSRRWLQLGPIGLQAGEVVKLAIVVYLAASMAKKRRSTSSPSPTASSPNVRESSRRTPTRGLPRVATKFGVLPYFVLPGLAMVLLLGEPDFGTAVLIACITFLMLFVGGARVGTLAGLLALTVPVGIIVVSTSAYRMRRVLAFLDPWAHRYDIGYQITESLMTIGSGGLFGHGLGESKQKLFFLPAAHTDFIFSIVGEELGFIGVVVVLGAFAVIAVRSLKAALASQSTFHSLLIIGLSSTLLVQASFNVAVALGLVPTKGITLPFVSYGGSSLVMSMLCAGVLLRTCADALAGVTSSSSSSERSERRRETTGSIPRLNTKPGFIMPREGA